MHYLGIDAGASATQWALINENGLVKSGVQEAMDGHLYRLTSVERMRKVLSEIAQEISGTKISSVYMGITGVMNDGSIEKEIDAIFRCQSTVVSDIELAYRANFSAGEGILLYAGTGSVSYAIDQSGHVHKIGGWGYLLGDEGAGYWIGKEAIRLALFQLESKKTIVEGSLSHQVLNAMQAHDWETVKTFVYAKDRSAIAALSRIVDSAATSGDAEAVSILNKAAAYLAELVDRIDKNLERKSLPVKFTGGISGSKALYSELEKFLRMRVSISEVDIAFRAAELAR
jgi:N-acetylglucosamine kinase-like BadF-type ATPase